MQIEITGIEFKQKHETGKLCVNGVLFAVINCRHQKAPDGGYISDYVGINIEPEFDTFDMSYSEQTFGHMSIEQLTRDIELKLAPFEKLLSKTNTQSIH